MQYKLTSKVKHARHCKDGKDRNILQYFLNNVLILEQKFPFDENYDYGYEHHTDIRSEYLLNGSLYQTRQYQNIEKVGKARSVKYPISKNILKQFEIPKDFKISIS